MGPGGQISNPCKIQNTRCRAKKFGIFAYLHLGYLYTKNQKNLWSGCRDVLKKAYFSHLFSHFWPKKIFSCKTAYAIFKVVYQASHIPKIRKNYGLVAETCSKRHIFHTFFAIFGPKKNFLAKLPMPYSK